MHKYIHANTPSVDPIGHTYQDSNRTRTTSLSPPHDPETRHTSKQYFKLIPAINHMDQIRVHFHQGCKPITGTFVKPSTPTIDTCDKIHSNISKWMQNTTSVLHQYITIASVASYSHNSTPLQIATSNPKYNILPTVPEAPEELQTLPKPQAPSKLFLHLGPSTFIIE